MKARRIAANIAKLPELFSGGSSQIDLHLTKFE